MNKGRKIVKAIVLGVMIVSMAATVNATNLNDQADQLEDDRNELVSEQKRLEQKLANLTESMKQAESEIAAMRAEIEAVEESLVQAKVDENSQYERMKIRIQYMYENNNTNFLQLLMESDNLTDFLSTAEYVRKMSEYDRDKLDEFAVTIRSIEDKEAQLQADYQRLSELQVSIAEQSKEAERLLSENASELASLNRELDDIRQQIKQAEEESKKQQEQEEANKPSNKPATGTTKPPATSGNGKFTHPCPGLSYISSTFSEVRDGVNDPNPHKGVDMAAAKGTPIYAAAAGKVLYARWSSTAGYWVVIDHGDGFVTKYMHMFEAPYVSEGQRVKKGQHIGGVGNTGNSFGNHLHFQVELHGKAVNPMKYL